MLRRPQGRSTGVLLIRSSDKEIKMALCGCGCGQKTTQGRSYVIGHNRRGKSQTSESLIKMGNSLKKLWKNPLYREHMSKVHTGHVQPEAQKAKIGLKSKKTWANPEFKAKMKKIHEVVQASEGYKLKMKEVHTDKWKEKIRQSVKKLWEDPEYIKKMIKSRGISPNRQEIELQTLLNILLPKEYKFVGNGEFILGRRCPDFLNVNGQKKIIEFFGDYWHKEAEVEDRKKNYERFGFKTLIIWSPELMMKNRIILSEKILKFNAV